MLTSLSIKNIALIENISVEFKDGLNILSGETGAGKSIIIDSLNFVLGERADKTLIRYGAEFAEVEAVFADYQNEKINAYLDEIGVSRDEILILRRVMSDSGKNECRINGRLATLSAVKGLTELMVDIHGQHEHQSLLRTSTHSGLLDMYGGAPVEAAKADCAAAYKLYREAVADYKKAGDAAERERKLDVLSFQIAELEKAELREGEEEELLTMRKKFRNIEKIVNSVAECAGLLNGNTDGFSVVSALNKSRNSLSSVSDFDGDLVNLCERLDGAKIEIKDIADTLDEKLNEIRFDDYSAEKTEERLETVRALMRKYGGSVESAIAFLIDAKAEYDFLTASEQTCAELEKRIAEYAEKLLAAGDKLHSLRTKYASAFEKEINSQLNDLGMGGARFKVEFGKRGSLADDCTAQGYDVVEFLISANKGEPEKPLAKIISGGEMSRFMLALKNIIAKLDGIETMIFDEIDTGISGNIAQVVAEKLYNISHERQVVAVTHLPQLAAMADVHYKIEKFSTENKTVTSLTLLDSDGQVGEIARLIGGSGYSEHAVPHAKQMKSHSDDYKKRIRG